MCLSWRRAGDHSALRRRCAGLLQRDTDLPLRYQGGHARPGNYDGRALGGAAGCANRLPDAARVRGQRLVRHRRPKERRSTVVDKLNRAIHACLADPMFTKRLAELGGIPLPMTSPEFGRLLAEETAKWTKVIWAADLKAD